MKRGGEVDRECRSAYGHSRCDLFNRINKLKSMRHSSADMPVCGLNRIPYSDIILASESALSISISIALLADFASPAASAAKTAW